MAYRAYCLDCKRDITPKGGSTSFLVIMGILAILFIPLFGILVGIILFIIAVMGNRCPICNGKNFKKKVVNKKPAEQE